MTANNHKFIFYTIEISKVKSIFAFYYNFKASEVISLVGSNVGTEVVKRFRDYRIHKHRLS
ncbi:hypothetical protein J14TS2_26390 [Bacillus sp. J14TS2]|uniref:hypothetical protein n=1 Tax=Bacillus sp. J14TS2 TaxID=2807188 RepID=UPI001B191E85|nr:hypothetical protein [Bacillus sp. J14TS2]GIN72164.1 hypothetical protein J14TS2_26390 [Bacillus sp. J14TS2]